jgi:nucleoside-diphosphate-sugar epimerase
MKMTILGAGFTGKAIARACEPDFVTIFGTTRSAGRFDGLAAAGITPLVFDGSTISPDLAEALASTTHLVQSIAPGPSGDLFLPLAADLRSMAPNLAWFGYLSTIGVYGDHKGGWVDESMPATPASSRSRERVLAETQWMTAAADAGIPVAVLRLSGIYGPGRNPFVNLDAGTARRLIKQDQVFNRIRAEDIGRATAFLINRGEGGIFNITDSMPSPTQDVVEYAARLMGVPVPPDIAFETAELSPMQRSFYAENKRVSNRAIRDLGFEFLYPEYPMSLEDLWKDDRWKGAE